MTATFILLLICGAAAGGFLSGLAGFGTALFGLGFWLQIMSPVEAVSLAVFLSIVSSVPGVWMIRHSMLKKKVRLARFLLPALVGIPLGVASLAFIDSSLLKLVIAVFLILYGGFFTFRKNLPTFTKKTPALDGLVGFVGGLLGGAAGLSGAVPTMWCAMRPWPKEETRAVTQPYNAVALLFATLIFAWQGVYDKDGLIRIAIAFPITVIFSNVGIFVFKQLSDSQYRRLLIGLMLVAGLVLSLRELL